MSPLSTVLRVTAGNFLEMYDFFLFGLYAHAISATFFPTGNAAGSLLLTFGVFGLGFLMRPLGAVVLGSFVDRVGRRRGLIVTLALMASGTVLIAFSPGYAAIGLAAPILVLVGRLLQGFSAGAELGGVSVYLAEMAPPGRRGFFVAWQSGSQQVAIIVAAAIGFAVARALQPAQIAGWGWRIPFVLGCLIVPVLLYVRRSLDETEAFRTRARHPSLREIARSIRDNRLAVGLGVLFVVTTTVSFYMITVYTPTFGRSVLHLSPQASLLATFCVGVSNLFWLPVMGALSDRVGRAPLLLAFSTLMSATAYPALAWLTGHASFGHLLGVLLWLSFLYGSYNGAMVVALTEIVPADARTTGFSLAYALATAVSGGFTPLACTWLIAQTGNRAAPGVWLTGAGLCGVVATIFAVRRGLCPWTPPRAGLWKPSLGGRG